MKQDSTLQDDTGIRRSVLVLFVHRWLKNRRVCTVCVCTRQTGKHMYYRMETFADMKFSLYSWLDYYHKKY